MDTSSNPKIMNMQVVWFPKVKSKSYYSQIKKNNSTELSAGHSFLKIYNRNVPPDPPQTPNPDFSRIHLISLVMICHSTCPKQHESGAVAVRPSHGQVALGLRLNRLASRATYQSRHLIVGLENHAICLHLLN